MQTDKVFVIAEMSANHNGDLKRAFKIIEAAKAAGADAIKLQTYTADEMTIDHDGPGFILEDGEWKGTKLYDLYVKAATPRAWHKSLFLYAERLGLVAFSSVFSKAGVDFLEELGCPIYKIASFEITDIPLIEYAASTGKPLIISTGVAAPEDVAAATEAAPGASFLYCVSDYPAKNVSLRSFGHDGLSDHTLSLTLPALSVMRGAKIIEKHLTLRRADGGPDAAFSLQPDEFAEMVLRVREAWKAVSAPPPGKSPYASLRRSVYAVTDITKGEELNENIVRSIRPGHGAHPKMLKDFIGKRASRDIKRGTPFMEDMAE